MIKALNKSLKTLLETMIFTVVGIVTMILVAGSAIAVWLLIDYLVTSLWLIDIFTGSAILIMATGIFVCSYILGKSLLKGE